MVLALSTFAASIETDRSWYLAGEAMKVCVTADNALIAYAELCDTYGLAAGTVLSIKGDTGKGVIELPSDLHSGYYMLSVYTRDNAKVTHRLVAVINPLHISEDDDIKWVEDTLTKPTPNPSLGEWEVWPAVNGGWFGVRETDGHIIKARVKNVYDGNTFKGIQIRPSLAVVGKQIHYYEGKMVNDSVAIFNIFGIHGKQPLVLSAMSSTGISLPIEIMSPFATLLPKELPHLVFHYKRSEVEARSLDMQRHQLAIAPAKRELQLGDHSDETEEDGTPLDYDATFFGTQPDLTYNLDEYRQFHTVREVLLEYVKCVRKKKINGVQKLIVRGLQSHFNSSWPAMVLIDGMPAIDIERLLDYDARRIHFVNIYGGQYTFGNGVYNGILSLVSRSGRLTNYPIERNAQYLVYEFPE